VYLCYRLLGNPDGHILRLQKYKLFMKNKTLWAVTIILSLTLAGFILIQFNWIKNAIELNEKQFNQLINKSLFNIVQEVEQREMVYMMVNEVEPYESTAKENTSVNYQINKTQQNLYGYRIVDWDKEVFRLTNPDSLAILNDLNFVGNTSMQLNTKQNFVLNKKNQEKLLNTQSISNPEFLEKLTNKRVFVENIVNKLIQVDIDLVERIDLETLDTIIHRELIARGIDLDYEFAVTHRADSIIFATSNYKHHSSNHFFSSQLFPNDVFAKDNYLNIYFPEEQNYIIRSTGYLSISSIILMLIILGGFFTTIHIMFKQKRLSQIKNDFVNNMTHELKTPISTISLASQMLKDKTIPIERKNIGHISSIIEEESKRLSYQVEKVLKTALLDQGEIKLKRKEVDVHQIIDNVAKNFHLQIQQRNGNIHTQLAAARSIVWIDEVHFTNILLNLLDNALKYSKDKPEIAIKTRQNGSYVIVSVVDKGVGIKRSDQKRVFDQFYRVSTGNVHDVKGFGLGLSYVKKIAEAHGGKATIESEYKKGSTFSIYIPINLSENGRN